MYGSYERTLDSKNRIVIPSSFRDELGSVFYMTFGIYNILEIRSKEEFDNLAEKFKKQSMLNTAARDLSRLFFKNTVEITIDSMGRVVIPNNFLEKAAIKKNITFVGIGAICEVWATEKWNAQEEANAKMEDYPNSVLQKAKESGIDI